MGFTRFEKELFLLAGSLIVITFGGILLLGQYQQSHSRLEEQQAREPSNKTPSIEEQQIEEREEPIDEEPAVQDVTTRWNVFRNERDGFLVRYPNEWQVSQGPRESAFFFGPAEAPDEEKVQIWMTSKGILDVIFEDKNSACATVSLFGKDNVFRCEGNKTVETDGESKEVSFIYVEAEHDERFYFLSVEGQAFAPQFGVFQQMLSVFQFAEN